MRWGEGELVALDAPDGLASREADRLSTLETDLERFRREGVSVAQLRLEVCVFDAHLHRLACLDERTCRVGNRISRRGKGAPAPVGVPG